VSLLDSARKDLAVGARCLQAFIRDTKADENGDPAYIGAILVADGLMRL